MVREDDEDAKVTEGMDCVETFGLPLTEWALKLLWGDPGLGCVYPVVSWWNFSKCCSNDFLTRNVFGQTWHLKFNI